MVFLSVPVALTGVILVLWFHDMPFAISATVGITAPSGVAVLNGVVMATFINERIENGDELEDATIGSSLVRRRPVLMTALVAVLAFDPMAIASGAGAKVQKPVATVGIVSATCFALVVLPAVYRFVASQAHRAHAGRWGGAGLSPAAHSQSSPDRLSR